MEKEGVNKKKLNIHRQVKQLDRTTTKVLCVSQCVCNAKSDSTSVRLTHHLLLGARVSHCHCFYCSFCGHDACFQYCRRTKNDQARTRLNTSRLHVRVPSSSMAAPLGSVSRKWVPFPFLMLALTATQPQICGPWWSAAHDGHGGATHHHSRGGARPSCGIYAAAAATASE